MKGRSPADRPSTCYYVRRMESDPPELPDSSHELLLLAIQDHARFKDVGRIFLSRDNDDVAAFELISAYGRGAVPPWLAAYLLGCLRARIGYSVVLGILEGDGRLGSESYAGVALCRIAGADAEGDLIRVMFAGIGRRNREGALAGLALLGSPTLVPAIVGAARDRRISVSAAGRAIVRLQVPPTDLAAWTDGVDELLRNIAIEAAHDVLVSHRGDRAESCALARSLEVVLTDRTVKIAPRLRERLAGRVREVLGAQ